VKEFGKGFASGVKGAVKFAGKVKKIVSEEDAQEGRAYGLYRGDGKVKLPGSNVKKEVGYLSKAVKTMKGKNVAKADKVEEAKNCGCGQNPCVTYSTSESREYSHNPEKYHDSQGYDKKLERDKPYRKRSKAARMADPDRGINSPAFKKFMADRGM